MTTNKHNWPDKDGFFGEYGGKFVPETLMHALEELEKTYNNFFIIFVYIFKKIPIKYRTSSSI